jgi:hypothetical protein
MTRIEPASVLEREQAPVMVGLQLPSFSVDL